MTQHLPAPVATCDLPALPDEVLVNVGFPTPTDVMVSRTDYAQVLSFINALKHWITAAEGCLKGQR